MEDQKDSEKRHPSSHDETVKHDRNVPANPAERSASSLPIPREVFPLAEDPSRCIKQYVLVEEIGRGGMGSVWRSWDTRLVRWVAIKFLSTTNEQSIRRFEREAQLSARLRHPNIASIHEVNEAGGRHFLVMDYIDGPSIGEADLNDRAFLEVYVKVCRAVHFAHVQSIVHRDIKPDNILMGKGGEPYVTDFGLAKILQTESSLSLTGSLLGTPVFMSPEQAEGLHGEIDARSDVYSLGATLYALLTGHAPFEGEDMTTVLEKIAEEDPTPATELNPNISPQLESILFKAMSKEKSSRYASASDLADDLDNFLLENSVIAKRPGTFRPFLRKVKKRRWQIIAVGSILVAAVVWGFVGTSSSPVVVEESEQVSQKNQEWQARFRSCQRGLAFYGFENASSERIQEARSILVEMPISFAGEVTSWFQSQVDRLPQKKWPKESWLENRVEARRVEKWCDMILEVFDGVKGSFEKFRENLREQRSYFSLIGSYQGAISLRLVVWPYAEVRTLRVGEKWVIRQGQPISGGIEVSGSSLYTPLEIQKLDIGEYMLVLYNEDVGEKEIHLKPVEMKNGGTYVCSGSLKEPDSIRISLLP